jgi:hypothetical protein
MQIIVTEEFGIEYEIDTNTLFYFIQLSCAL